MDIYDISKVIKLCYENYDEKTMNHVLRVADYAWESPIFKSLDRIHVYATALCHDLIEDTDITLEQLENTLGVSGTQIIIALKLLTKKENEQYIDYIKRIKESKNILAYCVKLADMKDHLSQKETLTDKLKEKYWNAIPYLL